MGYTAPSTMSTGHIVTASEWNTQVKDNIIDLHAGNLPNGVQMAGSLPNPASAGGIGYDNATALVFYAANARHYFRAESGPTWQATYASAFNVTSDEQLKKDVETVSGALDKVCQLRGVRFKWRHNDEGSLGLIAQETQPVFPEAVQTTEPEGHLTVNYAALIGPLVEAVKELAAENADLLVRVEQLEAAAT